jgi:hypothetical protein
VQKNLEKAVILIVFLSILPMIVHWLQERRRGESVEEAAIETVLPGVEVSEEH